MAASTLTGRTLGHYQVLEPLGEGGMGVVYKARDTRLGRLAAIKVMHSESEGGAAADLRRRLLREAQSAAALNHPNVLTVYDVATDEGLDYIAMELVTGGTLGDLIASGPIAAERALRLAAQVADALVAAHAASLVHRDLKPANIMMPAPDRVKVVDFGLAKSTMSPGPGQASEATETATSGSAIVGTASYMSPEQATGRPVDARSDLFSLGIILYEMLAGRKPFRGDSSIGTIAAILKDTPAPIPGVTSEVARIIDRCLRKDPGDRYQSALELRAVIDACLAGRCLPGKPSVAVLPFTSMTGAKEDEYLCEGLAEEIIDGLTRIPGLRVIARTSAFAVGRMGLDLREVGARLDVGTVLQGSLRRSGSRVRVMAQLVSTSDGSHLWRDRYDLELIDVLQFEEQLASSIAGQLRVEFGGGDRRPAPRVANADAHTAYLEGRYYFARGTPEALVQAMACYQRAVALDPGSALAYDSLGELYWYLGFFGNVPPRDAFTQSTWHAMRALELDDTLAQTHALLGMLRKELDYNWPEVEREMRRALQLNRESPVVRLRNALSWIMPLGRPGEALAEIEGIIQTDPLNLLHRWWAAIMAWLARRPDRAIGEARHIIALDPTHFLGHHVLGTALTETGALPEAVAALEKAYELSGGVPAVQGFLAYALGRAGRREEALALIARAEAAAVSSYVPPSTMAFGYVGLGDWDAALQWWDKAIDARDPIVIPIKSYAFFDPVRGDPRFRAMLAKMHLA